MTTLYKKPFDESLHPRGQPDNAGEFADSPGVKFREDPHKAVMPTKKLTKAGKPKKISLSPKFMWGQLTKLSTGHPVILDKEDPKFDSAAYHKAISDAVSEIAYTYKDSSIKNVENWYDQSIKDAFAESTEYLPELKDPDWSQTLHAFMLTVVALTSPANPVPTNWAYAMGAVGSMLDSKGAPQISLTRPDSEGLMYGVNTLPLSIINSMLRKAYDKSDEEVEKDKRISAVEEVVKWLATKHDRKVLYQARMDASELVDGKEVPLLLPNVENRTVGQFQPSELPGGLTGDKVLGFAAFGPKVSRFFQNLTGHSTVTVDVWMARWIARNFGLTKDNTANPVGFKDGAPSVPKSGQYMPLVGAISDATEEFNKRFRKGQKPLEPQAVQALAWFFEQGLWSDHGYKYARPEFFATGAAGFTEDWKRRGGGVLRWGEGNPGRAKTPKEGAAIRAFLDERNEKVVSRHARYRLANTVMSRTQLIDWLTDGLLYADNIARYGFDPNEPRDTDGKWTDGGGTALAEHEPDSIETAKAKWKSQGVKAKAFKNWFGDWEDKSADSSKVVGKDGKPKENYHLGDGTGSKVVDEFGKPELVYHGTSQGGFNQFDKNKQDAAALHGPGFYFTEDKELADSYQDKDKANPKQDAETKSVYLNIRKPFDADGKITHEEVARIFGDTVARQLLNQYGYTVDTKDKDQKKWLHEASIVEKHGPIEAWYLIPEKWGDLLKESGGSTMNAGNRLLVDKLKAAGYDGITHIGGIHGGKKHRVWIAFEPNQIKSADNQGTFDTANPDIRYSKHDVSAEARDDLGQWTDTGKHLGGLSGAKLVKIGDSQYVMKAYSGRSEQARSEFLANKLYQEFGEQAGVPESQLHDIKGKTAVFNKFVKCEPADSSTHAELAKNFVLDAWLANWDVIGTGKDNIAQGESGPHRLDNGGALLYRAQGSPKGSAFGNTVPEIKTMRDPEINPDAADVFGELTNSEIKQQISTLAGKYSKAKLSKLVESAGLDKTTSQKLVSTLDARLDYLKNLYRKAGSVERYEVQHAPVGGTEVSGKDFKGGQFIPGGEKSSGPNEAERKEIAETLKQVNEATDPQDLNGTLIQMFRDGDASIADVLIKSGNNTFRKQFLGVLGDSGIDPEYIAAQEAEYKKFFSKESIGDLNDDAIDKAMGTEKPPAAKKFDGNILLPGFEPADIPSDSSQVEWAFTSKEASKLNKFIMDNLPKGTEIVGGNPTTEGDYGDESYNSATWLLPDGRKFQLWSGNDLQEHPRTEHEDTMSVMQHDLDAVPKKLGWDLATKNQWHDLVDSMAEHTAEELEDQDKAAQAEWEADQAEAEQEAEDEENENDSDPDNWDLGVGYMSGKPEEAKAVARASVDAANDLDRDEKLEIRDYTDSGFSQLNSTLRNTKGESPGGYRDMYNAMKNLIEKTDKWNKPVTVYRGIRGNSTEIKKFSEEIKKCMATGGTFTEHNFQSTSLNIGTARGFAGAIGNGTRILMHIQAKSGAYMDGLSTHGEEEIVKLPGTQYKPTAIRDEGGLMVVECEEVSSPLDTEEDE